MKLDTRYCRGVVALATLATALGAAPLARADWREPVGGPSPINALQTKNAQSPSLTTVGGAPHVAWVEDTTQPGQGNSSAINVARFTADGKAWERLAPGSPITRRATASTSSPSLADVEGVPWVAWAENSDAGRDVHVARLAPSGVEWTPMDDGDHPINHDPSGRANDLGRPIIAASDSRPYVAFWERDPGTGSGFPGPPTAPGKIWVVRLSADGTSWEEVGGGPVNIDNDHDALVPALSIIDGRPWVSYIQLVVPDGVEPQACSQFPFPTPPCSFQIRVAHLSDSGTGWTQVGAPLVEMPLSQPQESPIAPVDGVPTVALANANTNRIDILRPSPAGGSEWQRVGDGPASPAGAGASSPSLTSIGAVPWVSWSAGGIHAARLDGNTWRQAGSEIDGGGGAQLASVNGFPWVGFTRDDRTNPNPPPGQPACCSQARVTRLEPTFSSLRAFPAADTATLLSDIDAFGLPYPVAFEYGEGRDGAAAGATPMRTADGDFVLGEAKGLKPATLYWYRPIARAGTPLPLAQGPRDSFATPPASAAAGGGTGSFQGTAAPQTTVITRRARFIVAIIQAPTRVRRGGRARVRVLCSEPGSLELTVRRRGRTVRRITRAVRAGTVTLTWRTRRAAPRRYRLRVRVRSTDGRTASDAVTLRVVRRRASS